MKENTNTKDIDLDAEIEAIEAAADKPKDEKQTFTVTLKKPIKVGSRIVKEVTLYEPYASELAGINLFSLQFGNLDALRSLLPIISQPRISSADFSKLCGADCLKFASVVTGFLYDPSDILDLQSLEAE